MRLIAALAAAALASAWVGVARADDDPARWLKELDVEAGLLEADLRLRELDLRNGVKVRLSPYYLRADRVHLSLGKWGVRVKGDGILGFCPCESPPIAIGFSGGWAGPPDELIVEDPTLRVFGLPVFWLPYLWLRSPRKIGLTVPDVSFRGLDGLFLGQGLHVPLGKGLETSIGAYTRGGYAATFDLATERTRTQLRFDFRQASQVGRDDVPSGAGLALDARGDLGPFAWDVDAIRGARGVRTTLDLESLARPYDRGAVEARVGPTAFGLDAIDRRGQALDRIDYARPWSGLGWSVPIDSLGAAFVDASFGPRLLRARGTDVIGDARAGLSLAGMLGVATWKAIAQLDGRLGRGGGDDPAVSGGGGAARAFAFEGNVELALPLARPLALERAKGGPPVLHVIEPLVRSSTVVAHGVGDPVALAGFMAAPAVFEALDRSPAAASATTIGARTSLGSFGGGIAPGSDPWMGRLQAELAGGALLSRSARDAVIAGELALRTHRASGASFAWIARGAVARSLEEARALGWIAHSRLRWETAFVGPSSGGFGVELRASMRGDVPVIAGWALLGADVAPRLATATAFASSGATLGIGAGVPLGLGLRIGGDVDVYTPSTRWDPKATRLLDVRSTLRFRHPCGCFRLGLRLGRVVGREGIDVFATIDLAPTAPERDW